MSASKESQPPESRLSLPEPETWRHLPRFYCEAIVCHEDVPFELEKATFQHAIQARRLKVGQFLILFNGSGTEYLACIESIGRSQATARWKARQTISRESNVQAHLVVGLIASEKMDWLIQKATELGVSTIQPVSTQHSFQLASHRWPEKAKHWKGVMIAACEQSGRNIVPELYPVVPLSQFFKQSQQHDQSKAHWLLSPHAQHSLMKLLQSSSASISMSHSLFIGPEGGFSMQEEQQMIEQGCIRAAMGPRILRAETAAVAALSQLLLS